MFGAGGDLGNSVTHTVALDCLTFCVLSSGDPLSTRPPRKGSGCSSFVFRIFAATYSPHTPLLTIRRWFSWTVFLPRKASFVSFVFLGVPYRLRRLAVQRRASGSRMFDPCSSSWNQGFPELRTTCTYTAYLSGPVLWCCL